MSYTTSNNGLEELSLLLGFGDQELADVVLAAIDFEGGHFEREGYNSQFGISTLDTRSLLNPEQSLLSIIATRAISTGSRKRLRKATLKSRLAIPEWVSVYDLAAEVRNCLAIEDNDNSGEMRKIVLVHHSNVERYVLNTLRISKKNGLQYIQVALDTKKIATEVLDRENGRSLEELSRELGTPFEHQDFHCAANDADCTLRILLLLLVRHQETQSSFLTEKQTKVLNRLRQIAQAPLPEQRSDEEVEQIMSRYPNEAIDDPRAPIVTSCFKFKLTKKEFRDARKQAKHIQKKATFDAYKKSLSIESSGSDDIVEILDV